MQHLNTRLVAYETGLDVSTIRKRLRKEGTLEAVMAFYEKKHGRIYLARTSSLKEALTSLATWWYSGRMAFFNVGEVLLGANKETK